MRSLFVFHRDLTINDNLTLFECLDKSDKVYLCFVFTPEQVSKKNKYFNIRSIDFMIQSLKHLRADAAISFFYGDTTAVLGALIRSLNIDALWESRDVTPYAKARQESNERLCTKLRIEYYLRDTITLFPLGKLGKYKKYTPFMLNAKKYIPPRPVKMPIQLRARIARIPAGHREKRLSDIAATIRGACGDHNLYRQNMVPVAAPLRSIAKSQKNYPAERDCPAANSTTHLSAHLHFGVVTPRQFYWAVKDALGKTRAGKELIEQLLWREFYMYQVQYHHTNYKKCADTLPKMNRIKWSTRDIERWQCGQTGVPFVDAGMRELLGSGYMQNRARMVVAMFLVHYLGVHWKDGEKWFARHLVDYDYCNNFGGWVWCAGTEVHSNPYFRVFSMSRQSARFDPDCKYIKKWCPELRGVDPNHIHNWDIYYKQYTLNYPAPMVKDWDAQRKKRISDIKLWTT